jgi:hypothetical protein
MSEKMNRSPIRWMKVFGNGFFRRRKSNYKGPSFMKFNDVL